MQNMAIEAIRGARIDFIRFDHQPKRGLNNICPKGFAATTKPINSFPACGSSLKILLQDKKKRLSDKRRNFDLLYQDKAICR